MGASTKLQALVVDDLLVNRMLLGKLLQSFGFDVSMATDGREAVQRFLRQGTDFSCVWMDINMPGMDGLQASRQIRSIEAAQSGNSRMTSKGSEDSLSSSYQEEQVVPETTGTHSSKGSSSKPLVRRVPIVGVSACSLTEQLKSAALDGLPISEGTDKPWELCGMDLFVEKPINRSKLEAILDQLQGQLSMQSTECSASETEILEPPEPCSTQQDPAFALCSEPVLVTDCTVTSRDGGEQAVKRSLEATAMPETPVALLGPAGKRRKLNQILS